MIVLDRDLPVMHGDEVCRALVAEGSESRVLMLTAADAIEDRIEGLGLGADDYLPKPFDFGELVARIRALARRSGPSLPPTLEHGDLSLDPARRVAVRGGRRLALRPKEFGVLECLLAAQGRVVSAEELLQRVWDEHADPFSSAVKNTISRLRAELGNPPLIDTVRESRLPNPMTTNADHPPLAPRSWLRLPRRTARLRLSLLYGGLFLVCGAGLLAITYGLVRANVPATVSVPGTPNSIGAVPQHAHRVPRPLGHPHNRRAGTPESPASQVAIRRQTEAGRSQR